MGYTIEMACISHKGKVRDNNEDNFYFQNNILDMEHGSMSEALTDTVTAEEIRTVAVFDGMGGENAGEAASYTAAEKFREICKIPRIDKSALLRIIETLNSQICEKAKMDNLGQIGTTATMLFFHTEYAYLMNVGDSPAYILRGGRLKLISEKHTDEKMLKLSGIKNRKPALTQFLGMPREEILLDPYIVGIGTREGDVFLICSDGLTDMVPELEIQKILKQQGEPSRMVQALLEQALLAGGKDNVTIICCKVRDNTVY